MAIRILLVGILCYAIMAFFSYVLIYSMQPASHTFAERFWGG